MAIDSTAELLFKINANTDDAQGNIAKFRTLLSKDLSDIGAEFESWSSKVLGELTTVQGMMTAGAAVLAAGIVAVGAAISKADEQYDQYVNSVSRGMRMTGLQAEQMSTVTLLAEKTGTSYDSVVNGLLKFSSTIVKASEGNQQAQKSFQNLGISQDQVVAGQKDLMPLLALTMDAFHNNASAVQKAAMARDLFGRGGTEMLTFLSKGSVGLEEMRKVADKLGLTLGQDDVEAARALTLAGKELDEQIKALEVSTAKTAGGFRMWFATMKIGLVETVRDLTTFKGFLPSLWDALKSGAGPGVDLVRLLMSIGQHAEEAQKKIEAAVKTEKPAGEVKPLVEAPVPDTAKIKEATADFYGLDTIIESINSKIAASGTKYTELTNELQHYQFQIQKASEELQKAHDSGKITEDEFQRNTALIAQMPDKLTQLLQQSLGKLTAEERTAAEARVAALDQVHAELAEKLAVYDSQDYEQQRANLEKQMAQLRQSSEKKAQLGNAENALLAQIRQSGLNKIARDEQQAFLAEIGQLQQHLEQMVVENLSVKDKLGFQYQQDLRQFSAVEEAKALALHKGEAEQATIRAFYDQIRSQSTQKYQKDLQQLINSQGWQGVFGDHFASLVRRNEALSREWATSTNQSHMMVSMSLEALKELGEDTFKQLAQGMGQNIAHALIYSQSVGKAMREAAAATIESIASEAIVETIWATGWGFYDLARGRYDDAGKDFAAAAIWGSIGGAAAITGRAIAPKDASSTPASASGSSATGSGSTDAGSASSGSAQAQPSVYIHVNGSIIGPSGASELCDIINQAVYGNDATLYASHSKTGVPIK